MFKITLENRTAFEQAMSNTQELDCLESDELSEWIMQAFEWPKVNSDFSLIWGSKTIQSDIYELSSALESWLAFVHWLQKGVVGHEHFAPWTSGFQMSFEASRDEKSLVTMRLTGGTFYDDPDIPNIITDRDGAIIIELAKLFLIVQQGLAALGKKYCLLDHVIQVAGFDIFREKE
ncbi:MAG TPA: hypothetical protein ENJ42_10160 [Hellea balneolensis]|uniref:Uncharacterized protein n=1 Tax=Hellea balneolensis TaxID=287478 RepID=A0A7C5M1D6_9PROT|nr:hypothetical protein [Hellea balneolensis]